MRYKLSVVPPGGGEVDWGFEVTCAIHVPRAGEYILVAVENDDPDRSGAEAFLVRYATTFLKRTGAGENRVTETVVEVEPVRHPLQSKNHAAMCDRYDGHWGHPT